MQLLLNISIFYFPILLIAFSFHTIYQTSKFFHIAHAMTITLGAYLTYLFSIQIGWRIWWAILFAATCATTSAVLWELFIFKSLRKSNTTSLKLMITSLGIYVVMQNLVSLTWGDDIKSIRTWSVKTGHNILGAYITDMQIAAIVVSIILLAGGIMFLHFTSLGKQIRAVSSNPELSNIFGISSDKIILISFIIGSAMASMGGILIALDTDMSPTMGFRILLYAAVAMIIGGIGSYRGLIGGALLLSTAQHLSAYYIDGRWMEATAYVILVLFLFWKPLGFSGNRLKKIEI